MTFYPIVYGWPKYKETPRGLLVGGHITRIYEDGTVEREEYWSFELITRAAETQEAGQK